MIKKEIKIEWQNQDGETFRPLIFVLCIILLPLLIFWVWSDYILFKAFLTLFVTILWFIVYHNEFPKKKMYLIDK